MASTRFIQRICILVFSLTITGCYDVTFEGKSIIQQGRIEILQLKTVNGKTIISDTQLLPDIQSDEHGNFRFSLSIFHVPQAFLRIHSQKESSFRCQLPEGCFFGNQNSLKQRGDTVNLGAGLSLSSTLPAFKLLGNNSVKLDIINDLTTEHAQHQVGGMTAANISSSQALIKKLLGLNPATDLHQFLPSKESGSIPTEDQLKQFWLSHVFLNLANKPEWDAIAEMLNNARKQLRQFNEFMLSNQGILPEFALDQLFGSIANHALSASQIETNPLYKSSLKNIAKDYQQRQSKTLQLAELQFSPIKILAQPQSLTRLSGQSIQLYIKADNPWPLSYQWQKDGVNIQGENRATYTLQNTKQTDSGSYSVLVSNRFGGIPSQQAQINILSPNQTNNLIKPTNNSTSLAKQLNNAHSIMLEWEIPTKRENNSTLFLHEIKGYQIQYGLDLNSLNGRIMIQGAQSTNYLLENLSEGRYYFVIATIDSNNKQGKFSSPISVLLKS